MDRKGCLKSFINKIGDMNKIRIIRNNLGQILAITEKEVKLQLRFKITVILSFITPIVAILMPLIVMGQFFSYNVKFGPWNDTNYSVFVILTYNLVLLKQIIGTFPQQFNREKFWETLPALIIAPFNRINLLLGTFVSHLIIIFIPFTVFFILCWILYPIGIFTILIIIIIFFLISLIFSGIGLILGIFVIANENIYHFLSFSLTFIFWFSCISYPFELFPNIIQSIIELNPLYYIFDILRLTWIDNNIIQTFLLYPYNFLILIACAIAFPSIGVIFFNKIYKKYGIVGY